MEIDPAINNTVQLSIGPESPYLELMNSGIGEVIPGYLLTLTSDDEAEASLADGTTDGSIFAVENPYSGGEIDTPYDPGARIMARACRPGDVILAFIVLSGGSIVPGTNLTSSGASRTGALRIAAGNETVIAVSLDSLVAEPDTYRLSVRMI